MTLSGLLVVNDVVVGATVVEAAMVVEGTVVVGSAPSTCCSPRQPSRAPIAASPMTPASRTDQRR
jgi:hypothetical protein